jgi:hypothetical protein
MEPKNAKRQVENVKNDLEDARNCLNNALASIEKSANKKQILDILDSVDDALQTTTTTLKNYKD